MSRGRAPPQIEGLVSLKVDNISYNTSPADLRRIFDKYGDIGDIHIPRDRYNRQSRGFGFVRFHSRRDAEYAADRVDGKFVDGRELRVTVAKYERPVDEGGSGGGRRRSRSRSRSRSPRRRSRSRSPRKRSRSPRRSRSRSRSPKRESRSRSRDRKASRSKSRSKSRSASPKREDVKKESRESRSRSRSRSRSGSR